MKKLGKLTINPEKVITNDELINLKGGDYGLMDMRCLVCYSAELQTTLGILWNPPYSACNGDYNLALDSCQSAYGNVTLAWCSTCQA